MAEWWHDEAALAMKHVGGRADRPVLFETGYGPSGLPHLGTFAEVARTAFVRWAFAQDHPEVPTRLVAFSDDMDGLRSVPENVPNREMLREHLGKPLSRIPDPYGRAASYSAHMIGKLREFVHAMGVDTEFMTSSECYASGTFDEGLQRLLSVEAQVKDVVLPTLQPETRVAWSPFLPICEACGRYTTTVTSVDPAAGALSYACNTPFGGASGCGHTATTPVTGGRVKVGWKIDWALRWWTLGVDYEMYGKDLIESADISAKIVRLLGSRPPAGTFYEMFLDEEGRKISKKIGNGVSLETWRSYAPDDAILAFLTKPPRKARRIGLEIVPKSVDELLAAMRAEAQEPGEVVRMMRETTQAAQRNHAWTWHSDFDFSLLVSLVGALGIGDADAVYGYLEASRVSVDPRDAAFARELVGYALAYDREVLEPKRRAATALALDEGQRAAVAALRSELVTLGFEDAEALQTLSYEVGKAHGLQLRQWFSVLYHALTGSPSGPRLGTLLALLGGERSLAKLDAALAAG
ncbi:MAG: lysine--tRNA ligase [Myxococcales bacterium]